MMRDYYNEIDPFMAEWLRQLMAAAAIPAGDVDTRDIRDVRPFDLAGYRRCHFFAGAGVWAYALDRAGWPADRPVWTGSCPCQPFSAAGTRAGFADQRHLWPAWFHLIRERGPDSILGEQVASGDGLGWLDLVYDDLQGEAYAIGASDLCSAGFGGPTIRQRAYFMAGTGGVGQSRGAGLAAGQRAAEQPAQGDRAPVLLAGPEGIGPFRGGAGDPLRRPPLEPGGQRAVGPLASTHGHGRDTGQPGDERGQSGAGPECRPDADRCSGAGPLGGTGGAGLQVRERGTEPAGREALRPAQQPGPTSGFWANADWIECRDAKWRPIEPGSFPLAYGAPARVGRLRGYGNALCAETATGFIRACLDAGL